MHDVSSFSVSIRRHPLVSSTIIGFARVVIDNKILLKEIPIFYDRDGEIMVQLSVEQVAACPEDMDMGMINWLVWHFRGFVEMAIMEEWKKQRLKAMGK